MTPQTYMETLLPWSGLGWKSSWKEGAVSAGIQGITSKGCTLRAFFLVMVLYRDSWLAAEPCNLTASPATAEAMVLWR